MSVKVGDRLPSVKLTTGGPDGPVSVMTGDVFAGKLVVLFAVPGAFTATCSEKHLPGFVEAYDALMAKGVASVACTAVNDIAVLTAWSKQRSADGKIMMLADGNADFAKAIGLDTDLSAFGMGTRSRRYAMIVDDGVVKYLAVEDIPPHHDKATAAKVLAAL